MNEQYKIDEIFQKYHNKIYRLALSIVRNERDAEDIVQNTVLKIIKNLKNFRSESKLSTWIYRIAYNETLMYLRRKYRQLRLVDYFDKLRNEPTPSLFINWPKLPPEFLLDDELKNRLNNAIKNMPIRYRMPLVLHNVEEMPLKETAQILGLKLNSLKTRIHRAVLFIKSEMSEYYKDKLEAEHPQEKICNILTGFVYDYSQGNLGTEKETAFRKHIQDCVSCNLFLDKYNKAIRITKALQCQDIPSELKARIESFLFKTQ